MNMKKISGIAAGVALAFGLTAPAQAAVELNAGNYKITFNAFDAGTVGYGNTPGLKCEGVVACDAAVPDATKAPNRVGSEDTWGIFSVQSITNLTTGRALFTAGPGNYLTGIFGGLTDALVSVSNDPFLGPTTSIGSTGGFLNMYYNTVDYDASQGPAARLGLMGYNGITNTGGALALSANFGVSPILGDNDYTYFSNYNNRTLSGNSQGFLDVVAGDLADEFNTNGQIDLNGNAHDLFLKATFGRTLVAEYGWTVDATGDVQGAVPEPGSLALLGLGFAGLAGLRRRKAAK